ncbi:transporter substrate-binding domain-containing protein [Haematospirillum jordaniae]|uniref:Uncharacterized protein n=1 Tax=Haematospirillum jordaniae TaxID=1549855 RepID=A0A143DBS6_9PROT|nr:transporter substrate-binding domain-containing protein [Haematospirillum jordaniae]AMW34191.1 hypothetical protein AY555_02240 [Haematospirillum jordaniae]NKD57154.1 transporter substrate-binding domain-containing protein [Haematospirillum jordaniae]NKD59387.1 transporter substrate-binding domain-containing protein [Haematospirillum jordaniae]NKD79333.1 transporter substrate-binding domain-containing protein [Haematospirillum jordaniae]NKD81630.1 transporter substrate-binding domain-contai
MSVSQPYRFVCLLTLAFIWLAGSPSVVAANSRLETILAKGVLRVCMVSEYHRAGHPDRDVVLSRALAADLGVEFRHEDSSLSSLRQDIRSGRCDIAAGVAMNGGEPGFQLSNPYRTGQVYAIARTLDPGIGSWSDLDSQDRVVLVQAGDGLPALVREALPHARILEIDSSHRGDHEVRAGRADAFIVDDEPLVGTMHEAGWARTLRPLMPMATFPYAFGVPADDAVWLAYINTFVRSALAGDDPENVPVRKRVSRDVARR